jgi:hypothetical protein
LKESLAIQLEQSPLLQLVSDAELHNNLQYLGQVGDQRITPELAQQLGQRLGVKAYLAGIIANLGSSYVIFTPHRRPAERWWPDGARKELTSRETSVRKDADPDAPILKEAKAEYARLQ